LCHLDDAGASGTDGEDSGGEDTGPTSDDDTGNATSDCPDPTHGLAEGDPIELVAHEEADQFMEYLDATFISADRVMLVANNGWVVVDTTTGDIVSEERRQTGFRVDWDPTTDTAYIGSRFREVQIVDVTDPDLPLLVGAEQRWGGYHEDVSVYEGVVVVAAQNEGMVVLDQDLTELGRLPLDFAVGVALLGDRALVSDEASVVLVDMTDPATPTELDRVQVVAAPVDLAFDGTVGAAALGGRGVSVLAVSGSGRDTLTVAADFDTPHSTYGVSIDGEHLWVAAWAQTLLVDVSDAQAPLIVGHENMAQYALGIDALAGTAVAADWQRATTMRAVSGVTGPELDVDDMIWFGEAESKDLRISNAGLFPLDVELSADGGFSVSEAVMELCPGESSTVSVTAAGQPEEARLTLSTNDPDESSRIVELRPAGGSIGQPHYLFELEGFTWPDSTLSPYRLVDYAGEIVYLAYFAPS
jgi:hypothetical protein